MTLSANDANFSFALAESLFGFARVFGAGLFDFMLEFAGGCSVLGSACVMVEQPIILNNKSQLNNTHLGLQNLF